MEKIVRAIAWPMEKPQTFGAFHLSFLIGGVALCILLAFLLRNTSEKANKILLFSIGIFLVVCEVLKQFFYYYVIGNGSYQWWIFPFQLCSVPMYLLLFVPFIKNKKVQGWFYNFLATYNLVGGFVSMIEQSGLSHPYWFLTMHAYIWHLMLVFIGFYLVGSKRACKSFKDLIPAIIVFVCLCGVAQIINIIFREHHLAMFYISPFQPTPLFIFNSIEAKIGWVGNMIVYMIALTLGAFIFLSVFMGGRKLLAKRKKNA